MATNHTWPVARAKLATYLDNLEEPSLGESLKWHSFPPLGTENETPFGAVVPPPRAYSWDAGSVQMVNFESGIDCMIGLSTGAAALEDRERLGERMELWIPTIISALNAPARRNWEGTIDVMREVSFSQLQILDLDERYYGFTMGLDIGLLELLS